MTMVVGRDIAMEGCVELEEDERDRGMDNLPLRRGGGAVVFRGATGLVKKATGWR
jgi:hypothetical protein